MIGYVWRDLVRNPRRTGAALAGVALGVGLFASVLLFAVGSAGSMTARATAPLVLDMQRVMSAPLGRQVELEEQLAGPPALLAGDEVEFTLTVRNPGTSPANEVVVNDEPPPPLSYVQGTTTLDGRIVPDAVGRSPLAQGLARTGLNLGTLPPGGSFVLTYRARADLPVPDTTTVETHGTVSTRESVVPQIANAPAPITLGQLETEIGSIPGVAAADALSFVDLASGSLADGANVIGHPVRVFAFGAGYPQHHPSIRLAAGVFAADGVVVSAEVSRALGAAPGSTVTITLPDGSTPETLTVSGVADLSRATPLFSSRKARKLEDFLYVPASIVVSPDTFERLVAPAFRAAAATEGRLTRNLPVREVDILVDRSLLRSDPARALAQTRAIAAAVDGVAPGQDHLVDNISNALEVAGADAAVGRRMFVFLGLPAVTLAAFLAAYTGRIVGAGQRRDDAALRVRGAGPRLLRRMLALRALLLAGAGSLAGVVLGAVAAVAVLGSGVVSTASPGDAVVAIVIAFGVGTCGTGLALAWPALRRLRSDIAVERSELPVDLPPRWSSRGIDLVMLTVATAAEIAAVRLGAFAPQMTSVSVGESPSLPSFLLVPPLLAWLGGTLVAARASGWALARMRMRGEPGFGPVVRGTLVRGFLRRSWALGTGIVGVCLVTAFGVDLAVFSATYDRSKAADARFVLGGDLRITPSPLSATPVPASDARTLKVDGVQLASPVVYDLENSVLIGPYDQDRADLAAIDPVSFANVAPFSDSFFVGASAAEAMAALAASPDALLVGTDVAERLSVEAGDEVRVLLERGTEVQRVEEFTVVGTFVRFPGFPQGLDLVVNRGRLESATGVTRADFFVARSSGHHSTDLRRASVALTALSNTAGPFDIASSATALDKDRSSLTAFDLRGLEHLDLMFTLPMSVAAIAIFVVGVILQRRRELVTYRAQGMVASELRRLVLGEAGLVAVTGAAAGVVIGLGTAPLSVRVLRPLFVLEPDLTGPLVTVALIVALPIGAAVICSVIAAAGLDRIEPTELLRDD